MVIKRRATASPTGPYCTQVGVKWLQTGAAKEPHHLVALGFRSSLFDEVFLRSATVAVQSVQIGWGVPQTGFGVRSKLRKRRACTPGHRVSCHVFENLTKLSFHVFWGLTRLSFHTFWGLTRLSFHVVLGLDKALFPRVLGLDKAPFPRVLGLDRALFPRGFGA